MLTQIPEISPLPPSALRSDEATFRERADARQTHDETVLQPELEAFRVAANTLGGEMEDLAADAEDSADVAAAAAISAESSASLAGATPWVSGETFGALGTHPGVGDCRFSLVDWQSYRRILAGAGTTDPSLDTTNWTKAVQSAGAGGQVITGDATLTAASPAAITVNPSAAGYYAKMRNATTGSKGIVQVSISNVGIHDYGVKNFSDVVLGWVRPRTTALLTLCDNGTPEGVWGLLNIEKIGITATYSNNSASNTASTAFKVAIDANRDIVFFSGTTLYGVVYDKSTQQWGAATSIRTSVKESFSAAVLSATDQILVCTCGNAATTMEAVTLTIAGTGITVNTGSKASTALTTNGYSPGGSNMIAVGASFVFGYSRDSNVVAIRALTVAGAAPTIGAETALSPAYVYPPMLFATGSVVRAFSYSASVIYAQPFTVAAAVLTPGTAAATTSFTANQPRFFKNANGNVLCDFVDSNHKAAVYKLTGTVEAKSAVDFGFAPSAAVFDYSEVSASKTLYVTITGAGTWSGVILTDTAGTASIGSVLTGVMPSTGNAIAASLVSANSVTFCISSTNNLCTFTLDCSGTAPTLTSSTKSAYATSMLSTPAQHTVKGERNARIFLLPNRMYFASGGGVASDTAVSPGGISRVTSVMGMPNTAGAFGVAANDSYICQSFDGNSTGFAIAKVEVAA